MSYGLSSFLEIFHRENIKILGDLEGVQILFDDLIITGLNESERDKNLEAVLQRARNFNVKFNKTKLQYKLGKEHYMGLIFSSQGIKPDPA